MKPRHSRFTSRPNPPAIATPRIVVVGLACLVVSAIYFTGSTFAADGTWNIDDDGLWDSPVNWVGSTIADGSGFAAFFTNDITDDRTVSLDSDRTITNLLFSDSDTGTAASWLLDNNGISDNNLVLAGTTPTITVNTLGAEKTAGISAVIEGIDGLTKSGTGTLILGGANTYTGDTTINGGTIEVASGSFTMGNTVASFANTFAADSTLTLTGAGTWTLTGANTYTGATTITGGTLSTALLANGGTASGIGQASSSASNLIINGGTLKYTGGAVSELNRSSTIGLNGATIDRSTGSGSVRLRGATASSPVTPAAHGTTN